MLNSIYFAFFVFLVAITVALTLLFIPVRPIYKSKPPSQNIVRKNILKIFYFILPGAFDMLRGFSIRGWFTFTVFVFSTYSIYICLQFGIPSYGVGINSSMAMPNFFDAYPIPHPPGDETSWEYFRWTVFWSWYGIKTFVVAVALSLIVSLALHIARFKKIRNL